MDIAGSLRPRRSVRGIREYDIREEWSADGVVASTYYAKSGLILGRRELREGAFVMDGGMGWREVGLCMLHATGWRPDCSVGDELNSMRTPPPLFKRSAPIVAAALTDCSWIGLREQKEIEEESMMVTH